MGGVPLQQLDYVRYIFSCVAPTQPGFAWFFVLQCTSTHPRTSIPCPEPPPGRLVKIVESVTDATQACSTELIGGGIGGGIGGAIGDEIAEGSVGRDYGEGGVRL